MEHRFSERIPVTLPVEVYYLSESPIQAQVRNLGREGMFIDVNSHSHNHSHIFPQGSMVRLVFDIPDQAREVFRIPAMVVHNHDGGIGVMFQIIPGRLEKALDDIIENTNRPVKLIIVRAAD